MSHRETLYFLIHFFIGQVGLLVFADLSTQILRDTSKILADKDLLSLIDIDNENGVQPPAAYLCMRSLYNGTEMGSFTSKGTAELEH